MGKLKELVTTAMIRLSLEDEFVILEEMPCCETCALHFMADNGVKATDPYCFYHSKDRESMEETNSGFLSWGATEEDANLVVHRMQDVGLEASWDGVLTHRIYVGLPK